MPFMIGLNEWEKHFAYIPRISKKRLLVPTEHVLSQNGSDTWQSNIYFYTWTGVVRAWPGHECFSCACRCLVFGGAHTRTESIPVLFSLTTWTRTQAPRRPRTPAVMNRGTCHDRNKMTLSLLNAYHSKFGRKGNYLMGVSINVRTFSISKVSIGVSNSQLV